MLVKLVECGDYKVMYGLLDIGNHKVEDVQNAIYRTKAKIKGDWYINDLLEELPKKYRDVKFFECNGTIEI